MRSTIPGLTPFVYGTTRLGDASIPFADRVAIAREAMRTGVWFHTSTQYGDALNVLRAAFDEDRAHVPQMFYKIAGNSLDEFRQSIHEHIDVLGLDHMEVGQLCIGGEFADKLAASGEGMDIFRELKEEGLVRHFVWEVFPWTSRAPLKALETGHAAKVADAFIFYLNPLQRFASNELWDHIQDAGMPVIAMRTVSGGDVHRLRDVPGAAWKPYLQERAAEVAPVFERSGVKSWADFCMRFAHSLPNVLASVGSTSHGGRLNEFLTAADNPEPLPADIVDEILALQRRWSDETDVHAEPWSM